MATLSTRAHLGSQALLLWSASEAKGHRPAPGAPDPTLLEQPDRFLQIRPASSGLITVMKPTPQAHSGATFDVWKEKQPDCKRKCKTRLGTDGLFIASLPNLRCQSSLITGKWGEIVNRIQKEPKFGGAIPRSAPGRRSPIQAEGTPSPSPNPRHSLNNSEGWVFNIEMFPETHRGSAGDQFTF